MPITQKPVISIPRIPRLELVWTQEDENRWTCNYDLVLPLDRLDCRGTFDNKPEKQRPESHRVVWLDADNCKRIPLGRTEITGGKGNSKVSADGHIDTPFRDGAHIQWDSDKLGLRKFVVCGEAIRELIAVEAEAVTN